MISTSDASHAGGGAAEARSFRPNLNPAVQALSEAQAEEANEEAAFVGKGLTCHPYCFSVAGNSATAPCPWRCGFGSCSHQCSVVHMNECRLRTLPVQTVALYLDSPTRPLSWILAQCGAAVVFDPHGVISQRSLVCSETGPCTRWHGGRHGKSGRICACGLRMYSIWRSARVAVTLTSDDTRERPQPCIGIMTRFKKALDNGRRWLLFAPQRGKFWGHACVARMLAYDGVFRTPLAGAGRAREDIQVVALHNCQTLHQSVMELDCSSEQGILQLIPDFQLFKNVEDALLHNILDGLGLATAAQLPTSPSLWTAWLGSQLSGSTRRLQWAPVQESVVPVLADLLATMQPGQELEHLKFLLRWADHRGSDVRLLTNSVIHGSSQPAPYPAFAWDWESVQQYPWRAAQHINVLELTTLLNFLRMRAATGEVAGKRIFHIFDSLVAASVAAKGRSSARILNRICRRISAVSLCSGCLVVSLWTVSGWQHSDSASRVAVRRGDG